MPKPNWGSAAGGAASGAAIGSSFGPIGTAAGAIGGGLLGLFGGGKKKKPKKYSTLDKTQQGIYDDWAKAIRGEGGQFQDLFNFDAKGAKKNWDEMYAKPAYQQFNEEVVPGITGQFRGGNLQNSSYLGGALGKAGTDVQRNLNAHLSNMLYQGQQDSVKRRSDAISNLLNTQTFAYEGQEPSGGQQAFGSLMDFGGKAAASYLDNKFKTAPKAAPNPLAP
jgi:uncharacterized protein YcfJ